MKLNEFRICDDVKHGSTFVLDCKGRCISTIQHNSKYCFLEKAEKQVLLGYCASDLVKK